MHQKLLALITACALVMPGTALARGHGGDGYGGGHRSGGTHVHFNTGSHHGGGHARATRTHFSSGGHHRTSHVRATGVARDGRGRIKRSSSAKNEFKRGHPCPSTGKSGGACPGYVVDHVQALKHGGADAPHNMQWQTKAAAKAKDRWE